MVLSAGPERPWPVSGNSPCILCEQVPSVTGPADPDTAEAKAVAIGIADTGRTDSDPTKLEVGVPDPAQPDAGLEDTDSSDAGSTCVEHTDDGSAARDTDPARIDIGPMDPSLPPSLPPSLLTVTIVLRTMMVVSMQQSNQKKR